MTFNKKLLAGLVTLAAANAANATIVVGGDNGFEFSVDGEVNQFFVYTDDNRPGQDSISEVRDGLLPAFLGFNIKAPTTNGLDIAARVSISPSTNGLSYAGSMEQREAFFTVDGSFGQVLAGKALGLYGSHNILTDQTLYGVGWGTGKNGTTTLGGIGLGYDYADWRSQVKWTSPDMNGFKVAIAVVDPQGPSTGTAAGPTGPIGASVDSEDLRYEADLSYAGTFDGGSFSAWLSAMTQDQEGLADDAQAWTVGATASISGFQFMAQYSDSESATAPSRNEVTNEIIPSAASEWNQYIVQAGYNFGGTTLVSASYAELEDKKAVVDDTTDRLTVGVYHDVTANLKLVAEYTKVENDNSAVLDQDIFALGGFVSW